MRIEINGGNYYEVVVSDEGGKSHLHATDENGNRRVLLVRWNLHEYLRTHWPYEKRESETRSEDKSYWLRQMMMFGALPAWELARELER